LQYLIEIDDFLCRILRGENPSWPAGCGADFQQSLLQRSHHHGVQALVFERARNDSAWGNWPERVREELTDALRMEAAFDLLRAHDVKIFLEELGRRGLPFLLTKGSALAHTHYPGSALRARCDTDLFIDFKDIGRVQTALTESGYSVIPPIYKSHQFAGVSRRHSEASVVFDIHWRILNAPQFARTISFTEALEQSVPVPGMGPCRTLSPVDSLLLACMHRKGSAQHDEDRLIWLYDIHLLVSAMAPEQLSEFAGKAVDRNVQAACLEGLRRTQLSLRTEIPVAVIDLLATAEPPAGMGRRYSKSNLALLIDDLRCLPDNRAKWGLIKELFFPSAESLARKYGKNKRQWPLLYLRHILGGLSARLTLR